MEIQDAIGLAAAILTMLCMLPQVLKSWRTKKTSDLSWGYIGILGTALLLWIIYGFLISSFPIILANSVSEAMALALIYLKARHG